MNISRRPDIEAWLLDEMRRSFGAEIREGIHLTDLLNPRRAYWQRMDPRPLTDDELQYFTAGRAHEDALRRLSDVTPGGTRETDHILWSADFFTNFPIEFKTRRRLLAQDGQEAEVYSTYLEQLRGYCALSHRPAGWLWVMSLVERQEDGSTKPELRAYHVDFTDEELTAELVRLYEHRDALIQAMLSPSKKAHEKLPLCWPFLCGKQSRVMTVKPKCMTCHREFEGEWGAQRHVDSKTGRGHDMEPAEYQTTYQPKCKWYSQCEPWKQDAARGAP